MKINVLWKMPVTAMLFRAPQTFRTMDWRSHTNKSLRKGMLISFLHFAHSYSGYFSPSKHEKECIRRKVGDSCDADSQCAMINNRSINITWN